LILVPLAFTTNLHHSDLLARALATLLAFCALSSAGYLLNDVADVEADRQHPTKRRRPIASGLVPVRLALALGLLLVVVGLAISALVGPGVLLLALAYLGLTAAYTLRLKHVVLLDLFGIAAGFVLRAAAGAVAIDVPISPWFYTATMLGALMIGLGKRRGELLSLGDRASAARRNLAAYSLELIDQLLVVVASALVMTYALYTFSAENLPRNHAMMLTVPVMLYGMLRYLLLIRADGDAGAPEELCLRDRPLLLTVALWMLLAVLVLYGSRQ
jgi:4-hydroxybenzoate polyprenyltransferase